MKSSLLIFLVSVVAFFVNINNVFAQQCPNADFTYNVNTQCTQTTISFTNTSTAVNATTTYKWKFGNGQNSTNQTPNNQIYTQFGTDTTVQVTLIVIKPNCNDTITKSIQFNNNIYPTANFTFSKTSQCTQTTVSFTNTSTPLNSVTYEWDFGNGQIQNTQTPTNQIYTPWTTDTTVQVTLTVTNTNTMCTNSITKSIQFYNNIYPTASFSVPNTECAPVNLTFNGNGSTSGSGNVTLTDYNWQIDGTAHTSPTVNQTFDPVGGGTLTYSASLTVINSIGCTNNSTQSFNVNERPNAELIDPLDNFKSCDGDSIHLLEVYTNGTAPGTNNSYVLDWGDGLIDSFPMGAVFPSDTHTYMKTGVFLIKFDILGTNGCDHTSIDPFYNISNPAVNVSSFGNTTGCAPIELCFSIGNSTDLFNNDSSTTYTVDFGNGSPTATYNHPPPDTLCHTYRTTSCGEPALFPPNFPADAFIFTVVAENGCASTPGSVGNIKIFTGPEVSFSYSPEQGCEGNAVTFNNTTQEGFNSSCNNSTIYYWDFGDGSAVVTVFDDASQTHTYTTPGEYEVTLSGKNSCGTYDFKDTICILPIPIANYDIGTNTQSDTVGCVPFTISNIINTSNTVTGTCFETYQWNISAIGNNCANTNAVRWEFISGTSDTSEVPQIRFLEPGEYTLELLIDNTCPGTSSFTRTITVQDEPNIILGTIPSVCQQEEFTPSLQTFNSCYVPTTTFSWSAPNGSIELPTQQIPGIVTFNSTGNQALQVSATNICGTVGAGTSVNVKTLPTPPTITANIPCENDTIIITTDATNATPNITYGWDYPDDNATYSITNVTRIGATTNMAGSYILTVTDQDNCSDTVSAFVPVNILPTVSIAASDQNPCALDNIILTASGASNYIWQLQNGNSTTNPLSLNPTQDSTYQVIGTDGNGCENTASIFIDTKPLPIVNAGIDTVACFQTPAIPIQLTGTQNTGNANDGIWSAVGNIAPNTILSSGLFTPNATASNIQLVYTYTNSTTTCENTDTMEIDVINPQTADAGNDITVCQNDAIIDLTTIGNSSDGVWRDASNTVITQFNPTTDGTFQLTYTIGAGSCVSQDMMTITVHPLPIITLQNDFTICRYDTTIVLNNNTGTWTGIGIEAGTANFLPMNVPTNSTTLNYSVTDGNNCTNDDDLIVTVNDVTAANAGTDQTFCNITTDIPLTGFSPTTNGTGTWSGNGMQNNSQGIFNSNGVSGTYEVYYTFVNNDNCEDTDTIEITVNDLIKPVLQNDTAVCINTNTLTFAETPTGGDWTVNGISTNNTFTPNQSGFYEYIYIIEDGTTCKNSDTIEIQVEDLPQITLDNDFAVCADAGTIDLSESPFGGTWSGTGIINTSTGVFDVSNGTQTLTYTYIESQLFYNDSLHCSNNDDVTVTVNQLPNVTVQDTISYCLVDYDITLPIGTPNNNGTWSGTGITAPNQFNPTNAGGIGGYTATYTHIDGNGCENSDNMHIWVEASDSVSAGANDTICITESPAVLENFYPTTSGTWAGNGITNAATGMFDPVQAGPGLHTLTFTYGNGTCQISVDKIRLVVDTTVINAGSDQTACLNEPAFQLTGFTPNGGTWSGTDVDSAGIFTPTSVNSFVLKYTYAESINGCISEDSKTIVINDLPIPDAKLDTTLCDVNTTIILPQGTGNVGGTGVWSGSNAIIGNTNLSVNPSLIGANNTDTLLYTFTDNFGCSVTDSMEITVIASDSINAGAKDTVCINAGAEVLVGYPAGGTWTGTGIILDSIFNNDNNNTPANIYTLTYTFDNGNGGCVVTATRERTVRALPIVNAGPDEIRCLNEPPFLLTGFSPTGGTWSGSFIDSTGIFTPTQVSSPPLLYTYEDFFGCENDDAKTITITALPVPNAQGDTTLCDVNTTIILPQGTPILGGNGVWTGSNAIMSGTNLSVNPSLIGANNTDTLLFTFTDNFGCSVTDSMKISVIASDSINAGANDTVCINAGAEVLIGYPSGGTWSGNGIIVDSIFNNDNNNTPAGNYTLTYTFDNGNGGCEVVADRIRTVRALPIVDGGIDTLVCIETPAFEMFGFSPITDILGTGIWTGNGITDENVGIFESDTAGIGQHILTLTFTDFVGCIDSNTRVITVVDLPTIDALVGLDTLCNQPIPSQYVGHQNSGNPNDGIWSGTNMASDGTFTPSSVGDFTVYYCYEDNNMCERCDSMVITVIPAEPIDAGIADTICIDEGIHTLTAEFPTGGFWSGSMAILDADLGTFDPLIATSGWHTITYTFGTGTCLVSDTTGVYVRDLAFVDAGADENACDTDANFMISGFSPTGGVWSGTGITDNSGIFSPDSVASGTYPITYFYTDPITNCDTSRIKNVFVHPLAQPDFSFADTLCINVPYTITDLSTNTTQWNWSFGDGTTYSTSNPTHIYTTTGTYNIKLIATSVHGCIDSMMLTVFVTEPPTASFTKDTTDGCTPLPVNFTNTSTGDLMEYSWDLGNSSPPITTLNPSTITYTDGTQDTTYYIILTTSNLCGATTFEDSVLVYPKPQIIFAPDVSSGCTPLTVDFINNSLGNPDIFYWNYGDGNLYTTTNQNTHSHILYSDSAAAAIHTITLIAENECGLDTATTSVTVNPVTVESFFNADTTIGCQPFTVNFTNYSTQGTTVIWNFGDGSSADTIGTTSHTFQQAGTFKVTQYVTNGCGYDSTFTWITVLSSPSASFANPNNVCEDAPLTFINTTANTFGQIWDFGDGNTSTDSVATHIYTTAGTYQVTLTAFSNNSQCPGFLTKTITILPKPIAIFAVSDTTGCEDLTVQFTDASIGNITGYNYNFGNTNSSVLASPTHTYLDSGVYTVKYFVVDANTCVSDTAFNDIVVYPIPTSDFAFAIIDSCTIPTDVQFTNLSQGATGYEWTVDNSGNFLTANNPTVTYPTDGIYNINLTAINIYGCQDSSQQTFELFAPPVATWTVDQPNHCEPSTVTFTSSSTGNGITHYYDFGDSSNTTAPSPVHIFNNIGTYTTTYFVVDVNGCSSDTLTQTLNVHPVPISDFAFAILDSCAIPAPVSFTNLSQGATNYLWRLDNGDSTYAFNPTEIYTQEGIYTVELVAENSFGCRDSSQQTFELFAPPVAAWTVDQPNHCEPSTVTFTSSSTGNGITHYYDFGDSSNTTAPSPVHIFNNIGTYTTTYFVVDVNGCSSDTLTQTLNVHPVPISDFAFAILDSCAIPAPVGFTNLSQGATNYLWRLGNGDSTYAFNPTEIYTQEGIYTVELVAENSFGCRDSSQQTFELFAPPVAAWTVDQPNSCLPSEVFYTNNSTGNGLNHFYDFGDNNTTTVPSPTHIFNTVGTYISTYYVTDINGCPSDTLSETINVYPVPTSDFSFEIMDSCTVPTLVGFTNLSQGATNYIWRLDNGEILSNVNPLTYYNQAGTYTVELIAENSFSCRDSSQQTFEIFLPPTGEVTYQQLDTCEPSRVQFYSNATNTTDYSWSFGNGQTSAMAEPIATYQNVGIYNVELIIGVNGNCYDTLTYDNFVQVFPRPFANFTHIDSMVDGRFQGFVRFTNTSIGANQFTWDFGDNTTSNLEHPLHTYQTNGLFDVELIATNSFNCSDDTIVTVRPEFFGTLVLPNIMTPEYGVGEDKLFMPKGIGLTFFEVEVFDKNGTRVFFSNAIDADGKPAESWDGKYQGEFLPQGTYIWKVKAEFVDSESTEHRAGTITIIR